MADGRESARDDGEPVGGCQNIQIYINYEEKGAQVMVRYKV